MKRAFPKLPVASPLAVLRKAGYSPFTDPNTREESFVLRLSGDFYPRMHLYVEDSGANWSFNLHIDQKKPSYAGTSKHAGEYDGPTVEREMERLTKWVAAETGYFHPDLAGLASPGEPTNASPNPSIAGGATQGPPEKQNNKLFGGIFG